MAFSYRCKNTITIIAPFILFFPTPTLHAVSYGSDTAVSIVNPFSIPGSTDNIIRTFGAAKNGFAFVDSSVSCTFNSIYPVAGPVSLRGGKLYLQSDLTLTNTGTFADLGSIIGQDHAVNLSQSSNTFASRTNPSGARTLALVARTTATRAIFSVDWSYNNQYLAVVMSSGTGNELLIYSFNGTALSLLRGVELSGSGTSVRWRPNSYYLAVASSYTSGKIRVYLFTPGPNTLTLKNTQNPPGTIASVAWQGRGSYLAVAGSVVYAYRFNTGTELLDNRCTATNNAALGGSSTYDNIHWAPVGNKDDFIVGTSGGRLHLYNFDSTASTSLSHLKNYNIATGIRSLDWSPTSTYIALGFTSGNIRTYQHTAATNTIGFKALATIAAITNALSWKPNATELTAGFGSFSGSEHQFFLFNTTSYALTNVYNIETGNPVNAVKFSNTDGTYIARADNTTRYLSIYKENYSPFIFNNVNLFLNSNLTIGTPLTFIGNCTVNGRGNGMTFTGDGTINIATNSFLGVSNSNLFFERPNAFALQGKTSRLSLNDSKIGLNSDVVFGDGSWEVYNDVVVTGPHTFAYSTANTSTIHSNAFLTFSNKAIFEIGKSQDTGLGASASTSQPLEFENSSAHLVIDNATLHVTNSGLVLKKGTIDVYNKSDFVVDYTDTNQSKTTQALVFGDGVSSINSPTLILHGNGTNLTISNGAIVLDAYQTPTLLQFDGQAKMTLIETVSLYFKQPVSLIDGWMRPSMDSSFYSDPNVYVTAHNVRFEYADIFADYNVTGTLLNPFNTILGSNDYIFVNRGNSVENLIINGQGASVSGLGGPLGTITLYDANASFIWDVAGEIGESAIYLNGGMLAITQDVKATTGFTFGGTGTVDISDRTFELGSAATEWAGNIYWASNGGSLKLNNNVTLSGIWTFSGNLAVDGQDYLIDLGQTGTIILERGAHVTFSHMSLYNLSRRNQIVCKDNNCEIKLIIADLLLAGDYLFDKGSLYVYYNSTVGTIDGFDYGYTFTYASTQTSTIDSFCYFKVLANTRFSIGRQDSTKIDPEQQPLVFNDPLTSKLILDGGTLHITSSGMLLTKGTLRVENTSNLEIDTPKYEYGLVLGDGTLENDCVLLLDPGVQLNIKTGAMYYQNNNANRIIFGSPASALNIQSPGGFVAKTGVTLTDGWFRPRVATPFSIDPGAYITAENLRFDHADILSDYNVTGTLIDPLNITLGPNDSIAVTRGNSIENLSIVGQGALLSGVGGPLGTITLQDATASLTWDIANTIGINTIALNGGRIALTQNVVAAPGFTLQGTGTVDIGNQSLELGTEAAEWDGNMYWIGNGGSLKFNNDVTLSGIWTFSGAIVMDGQGYIIDFDTTGTVILERGAKVEFKNTSINNLSRTNPIACSDNNCEITFNFVDLLLSGDYLFDKGSIYFYYDTNFGTLDGLDAIFTFTYASTQTSSIDSQCSMGIWPNTRFSIGRQDSTITDPEQQPLVLADPLTSKIILNGGTLHITSSGMLLTKGILEVQDTSAIEVDTPKYEYGLVLGDGTLDNDFALEINPGVSVTLKTGSIYYQNNQNNRLVFGSPASSLIIQSPTGLRAKTDLTFQDGTVITENPTDIGVVPDAGVALVSQNVTKISRGAGYSVKKLNVHGGVHPYKLLNGDLYQIIEGYTTDDVIATAGTSYFAGAAGFGGSLSLKDHTVTLQTACTTPLFCNILLNGGTLVLTADGFFAADKTITGSGKVQFLGTKVSFGPAETNMTSTIYWQGLTSGDICLNSKASLSSTWTLGGLMHINGNGNIFDLSNRGALTIRPGATLALDNIGIKGLGSGKGNINFMSDTSTLKLSNSYLELDNNFSTTIGGIIVNGPTTVGMKNYNWLLDQKASMTVDGVTLWQDPLDQTSHGKFTFGSGPISKYLSLVSSGTIKTATNLDLVTSSTDDLETQIRTNSNALLYCCRTTSNALLFGDRTNSNAIIRLDRTVRTDSNAFARGIRNNSNAIILLSNETDDLSRTTSNALLYCCRTTSNALLFGDRNNSNAIIRLDRTVRTDSNAFARGIRNNSNALLNLASQTSDLSRTTSNALLYCCRTTSNALLFGDRTNSNAIIRLDRTVRTDSNAFARGIRNNSNAILNLAFTTSNLVINNSNAIIKLDVTARTNSNALLYCCRTTSNALLFGDRNNSNAIIRLDRTIRTDSNAFARGIRNNSNALLLGDRINSNAQLYCCRTSSNAIIRLDRTVRTDSNAFARGIRNNSNAILNLASQTSDLSRTTSNALLFGDRINSNAIIRLDRTVRTDSNAFARGIRNNSNAIILLSNETDDLSRTTSNALLYCCRTTSNALLFGDRTNSNAIIRLDRTVRTDSNAFARGIRNNSNAILKLASTTSNLVINNSNAIIKLDVTVRTNSNAQLYCCRTTSNSLLFGDRTNSNAIIRLDRTVKTDSNAFARGIRNNSNAILTLASEGSDLVRATSNALLYCCRTTSNALLFGDRNNSNAIISITVTTSNQFVINNSNAIVWLNQQLQTIDHGPTNITINTTSYQFSHDVFISSDHRMYIQNSSVINGHGHSIYCACLTNGVIDIATGSTVVFQNVAFRNYTDAVFNLGAGASVIFGDGVHLELLQAQTLERQWTFTGASEICGNGKELAVDPYAIVVAPHSRLNIHGIALTGLKSSNLCCAGNTASLTLSEVGIYLDHNFNFTAGAIVFDPDVVIVGTNTFVYASDMTSSIARDSQLYLSGITFSYAPQIANRDLFAMVDQSSRFFIDGCTLTSTTTGMRLTRGMLIADHKNFLDNTGGNSLSEGFAFGDGNPAHDLSIEVKPGGSLNLIAGSWDYVNA
ncbi:MAG: hypothetical protein WCW33_01495 [Candidatus Babeliales bacterium]|jgi:hypothetical protein